MGVVRPTHGRACVPLCAALLVIISSGCQTFLAQRPLAVQVRDAETKKPIAAAQVRVSYPHDRPAWAPADMTVKTQDDGIARLSAVLYGEDALAVETTANGYLPEEIQIGAISLKEIEPAHWFEGADHRRPNFVVDLYAEPQFTVELLLPPGYRGLVQVHVRIDDATTLAAGQRCFRYEVPPSGVVQAQGPPSLRRVFPPSYRARYSDGALLGIDMGIQKVGFRWLKSERDDHYFVVGTQPEYDTCRRNQVSEQDSTGRRSSDTGKAGGRGGRHRSKADALPE
jgi:hypothetical protein